MYLIDLKNATQSDLLEIEEIIKEKEKQIKSKGLIDIRKNNIDSYVEGFAILADTEDNEVNYIDYSRQKIMLFYTEKFLDFYSIGNIESTEIRFPKIDKNLAVKLKLFVNENPNKCIYEDKKLVGREGEFFTISIELT